MEDRKIDPRNIKLSVRTFDPNSPLYNRTRKTLISDIKPTKPVTNYPKATAPNGASPIITDFVARPIPRPILNEDEDLDALFKTPAEHHHKPHEEVRKESKKKASHLGYSIAIVLVDAAILATSFFNKARYHHVYIVVLILNLLLAISLQGKSKVFKWTYFSYQMFLVLVTLAVVALFTYNFINTNKIYYANYREIKNNYSSLTFQQKQDLAGYQDTIIFNRKSYISASKLFYGLTGAALIESVASSVILIKRY